MGRIVTYKAYTYCTRLDQFKAGMLTRPGKSEAEIEAEARDVWHKL